MGHFDEVCPLCGVSPIGPSEFTSSPDLTAEELTSALLEHFPDILSAVPTCETKEELEAYLAEMFEEKDEDHFYWLSSAFSHCIAIGYFGEDGDTPRKLDDDPMVKYRFPDGQFVEERWVDEASCGEFLTVLRKSDSDIGFVREKNISRTGASFQRGFGNFFLSRCCFRFLEGWIDRVALPPMWDGRQLSFIGELWEIVNSRETGRGDNGCLDWLEPGGAECKLSQTQYELAPYGEEIYPGATAAALQNGYDQEDIMRAIYEDYGYWMFVSPHEWPEAPESEDLVEVTALGFDVLPRASQTLSSIGCLSRLPLEILGQIFRYLPDVPTYLTMKLASKRMNELVSDTNFTLPILREIIGPDPTRDMFWIYPLDNQALEMDNFKNCLYSWLTLKCSSVDKESVTAQDILSHHDFPLIQFIHALYMSDCSRNRRRLWDSVKQFEEVWVDYRRNGWEVNRFGLPHPDLPE